MRFEILNFIAVAVTLFDPENPMAATDANRPETIDFQSASVSLFLF